MHTDVVTGRGTCILLSVLAGSLFLWLFWPSFNAALAEDSARYRAVVNTYLSLAGSVVATYFTSSLVNKGRKLDMVCFDRKFVYFTSYNASQCYLQYMYFNNLYAACIHV